ncbi:uncharacterized [Tachysurus ichikawai]
MNSISSSNTSSPTVPCSSASFTVKPPPKKAPNFATAWVVRRKNDNARMPDLRRNKECVEEEKEEEEEQEEEQEECVRKVREKTEGASDGEMHGICCPAVWSSC